MTRLEQQPPASNSLRTDTFEQRWRAWRARGLARETQTRHRAGRAAFWASVLLLAGWLVVWLVIGG